MAKQNKINLPSSGAGITRYFDDLRSKIQFKPEHVVVMAIVVILLVILLHYLGRGLIQ